MPDFKTSKDRLTIVINGAKVASDFKLKSMFIYHSENPRAFKNCAKSTLCALLVEQQSLDDSTSVDNMVYWIF